MLLISFARASMEPAFEDARNLPSLTSSAAVNVRWAGARNMLVGVSEQSRCSAVHDSKLGFISQKNTRCGSMSGLLLNGESGDINSWLKIAMTNPPKPLVGLGDSGH